MFVLLPPLHSLAPELQEDLRACTSSLVETFLCSAPAHPALARPRPPLAAAPLQYNYDYVRSWLRAYHGVTPSFLISSFHEGHEGARGGRPSQRSSSPAALAHWLERRRCLRTAALPLGGTSAGRGSSRGPQAPAGNNKG